MPENPPSPPFAKLTITHTQHRGSQGPDINGRSGVSRPRTGRPGCPIGTAPKIMEPIQKIKPNLGFLGVTACDRLDGNFAQLRQATVEISNFRHYFAVGGPFKAVGLLLNRQRQNASPIKFDQCLAATHLLQTTVRGSPVKQPTHLPGQFPAGDGWLRLHRLLNPIEDISAKVLATNIHVFCLPSYRYGVKCVLRSALQRGGGVFRDRKCSLIMYL